MSPTDFPRRSIDSRACSTSTVVCGSAAVMLTWTPLRRSTATGFGPRQTVVVPRRAAIAASCCPRVSASFKSADAPTPVMKMTRSNRFAQSASTNAAVSSEDSTGVSRTAGTEYAIPPWRSTIVDSSPLMRASSSATRLPWSDMPTILSSGLDRNHACFDFRRIGADPVLLIGGPRDSAGFEIHFPLVQRADDGVACDDAVAERSALMRTLVVDGEKAIAEVENGDSLVADLGGSPFTRRDAVAGRNADPAHDKTLSMGRRGINCVGFTGDWPSSHASRDAAFDFFSRSRRPCRVASGAYTVSLRTLSIPTRSTKS